MAVTLRFTVEDVAIQLLTYDVIRVYRSDTLTGTYSVIGTVALASGTYHYSYSDTAGDLNKWYKFSYYNTSTLAESTLSDPFRVSGVTRLRIRQGVLAEYGIGLVFAAATGGDLDTIVTDDYRIKAAQFPANRGKGTWLYITTGTQAGEKRLVKSSSPTAGSFDLEVALAGALAAGDEVEWHWLVDPDIGNNAVNRGMDRYYYVDRVPLVGVANQEEYDLSILPWLVDRDQLHDVRWYPTSGTDVDEPYAANGKWWRVRQDGEKLILVIYPTVDGTDTLYLECSRPMPHLYIDAAALPLVANESLCIALTWDEILSYQSRPGNGSAEERATWRTERKLHARKLHRLLVEHRPKPRYSPARLAQPTVIPSRFVAR